MKLRVAAALTLALAGCATAPSDPSQPISAKVYDGGTTLAVIGTPFFALAKATSCVATVLLATPTSAGLALSDRTQREWERQELQASTAKNCGGPYWLSPSG